MANINEKYDGKTRLRNWWGIVKSNFKAINDQVNGHVENEENPHSVTKAQVGLGNVDNYGTATLEEAKSGGSDTKFMTPLKTVHTVWAQVINSLDSESQVNPLSAAQGKALDEKKVNKENDKGLSSNDFTDGYKNSILPILPVTDFEYEINDGKVTITKFLHANYPDEWILDATVPETIMGYDVVAIGGNAFKPDAEASWDCIRHLRLPKSITSIGATAFQSCGHLQTIELPDGLTTIGSGCFNGCSALQCVSVPGGVKTIQAATFNECPSLSKLQLGYGVESIETVALLVTNLTELYLPQTVTNISEGAFGYSPQGEAIFSGTIYGVKGSYAESYAEGRGIAFVPVRGLSANDYTDEDKAKLQQLATPYKRYGVSIDTANDNPDTAVTYLADAIGMEPGSAAWNETPIFQGIRPCVVLNGQVQYYLNPNNLTQKADGTPATINSPAAGDVMVELPKLGVKFERAGRYLNIYVTDDPDAHGYHYFAHSRRSEGDRNNLYIGAYLACQQDEGLYSLSGKTPLVNQSLTVFRTLANAKGDGYDLVSFHALTLLQCLYLLKYKNLDSQAALGRGFVGGSARQSTGITNTKGADYGSKTSDTDRMCFLNIEDMWGNLRWWIDGLCIDAQRNILTAYTDYNDTGAGYTNRGTAGGADVDGYLSDVQGTESTGFLAKTVQTADGSETTYYTDLARLSAGKVGYCGGSWSSGADGGAFSALINVTPDTAYPNLGARLMYL